MEKQNYKISPVKIENKIFYPRVEEQSYEDPKEIKPSALPVGRVSVDDTTSFGQVIRELSEEFSVVSAKFPLDYLEVMQNLSMVNPDVAQMVDNIVQLGNTGHKIVIEGITESQQEQMLEELNSFQQNAFRKFGGADGFVNSLLAQIARGGAASVEWVISENVDAIDKACFVPLKTVRFVQDPETGDYSPHQKLSDITQGKSGLIELNEYTYQYCALQLLDNSPYAVPPILAALESVLIQRDIIKNFRFVAKKMGLLGFVTFLLNAPQRNGKETDEAYLSRCRSFLEDQAEVIKHNYRDGLALGFKDNMEVNSTSLMGSAQGASEIMKVVEEQVFSGLKSDPALHGRTYSTTETYAGVVYEKMLSALTNYQRTVKHVLEYGYKLHLLLQGFTYEALYVEFEPSKSLSSERDEAAYGQKLQNLKLLYDEGIISQEQRAQEAGYDAPDLPEPRVRNDFGFPEEDTPSQDTQNQSSFKFDKKADRYLLAKKKQAVQENEDDSYDEELDDIFEELYSKNMESFGCNHGHDSFIGITEAQRRLKAFMNEYFRAVFPSIRGSRVAAVKDVNKLLQKIDFSTMDSEQFANAVYNELASSFGASLESSPLADRVRKKISQVYRFFRIQDNSVFGEDFPIKPSFNLVDKSAMNFLRKSDNFYFGRYVSDPNTKASLKSWLQDEYLKSGRSLRDTGEMEEFRKKFGDRVAKEDYKVLRVVETSVSRAKNWGNVLTAEQAQASAIEITGPNDNVTCDWCRAMVGKEFKVAPVVSHVKDTMARDPEDLPQLNPFLPGKIHPAVVKELSTEQLVSQGIALAPYHPHCRHRFVVKSFE